MRLAWHVRWDVEQPGIYQLMKRPMSYPEKPDARGLEIHESAVTTGWTALAFFVTMVVAYSLHITLSAR